VVGFEQKPQKAEGTVSLGGNRIPAYAELRLGLSQAPGDYVLKEVSNIVRSRIRRNEVFSRYGGEEFALLLPETDVRGASTLAQEIRTLVASHDFIFDNQHIPITVSLGVAQWNPNVRTADEFIRIADMRLYQAKREGRNRVVT